MEDRVIYRAMKTGEEKAVSQLMRRVFDEFIAPEYAADGIEEFRRIARPANLSELSRTDHFFLVAEAGDTLIAMIAVKDRSHVSLMFVDGAFQRRGIGRTLLAKALRICVSQKPDLEAVTVGAAPNVVDAYRRYGFVVVGPEQNSNGIRYIPMALRLSNCNAL